MGILGRSTASLDAELEELRGLAKAAPQPADKIGKSRRTSALATLGRIDEAARQRKGWWAVFWDSICGHDDAVEPVASLRHDLCWFAPESDLLRVAGRVRGGLAYIGNVCVRAKHEEELRDVEDQIRGLVTTAGKGSSAAATAAVQKARATLERLSQRAAERQMSALRRMRLVCARLLSTAVVLLVCIVFSVWALPARVIGSGLPGRWVLVLVLVFGALGGVLSALRSREPGASTPQRLYGEELLLWLRPLIGAAAGFVLVVLVHAKVVSILPDVNSPLLVLAISFFAGFSEKWFTARVGDVIDPKD